MMSSNLPISERYRLVAEEWVALDSAARMYEESKSAVLSQRMVALGDMPVSRAELAVKASAEWEEYLGNMVSARTKANEKKVELEHLRMLFAEWNSNEANARIERKI